MKSFLVKGLLTQALESELDQVEDARVNQVENAIVDVTIQSEVQDDCEDEVTEAILASASLEQILAAIEPVEGEVIPSGGAAERILAVAVEQVFERLGQPTPDFLALESEGGLSTRAAQLKDFLLKMWQRIVEAFASIYDAVSDFLSTAFNAAARLERSAASLLRESRKLNGPPKKSTYVNKDMARRLSGDDSVGLVKLFDRTLDLTEITVHTAYAQPAKQVIKLVDQYMSNVGKDNNQAGAHAAQASYRQLIDSLPKAMLDAYTARFMNKDSSPVQASDAPDGVDIYTSDILMGGVVAGVLIPRTAEDLSKFSFFIKPVLDDTDSGDLQADVPVSDTRQQEQLLKMVITNCGQIRRFNKNLPDLKLLEQKLNFSMKHLRMYTAFEVDREIEKAQREVLRAIAYSAPRIAQGIHQRTFAHALNASRTILKHVQYSIQAYDGNEIKTA